MIQDTLSNSFLYKNTHPLFEKAFAWLRENAQTAPAGKNVIEEDALFAMVDLYDSHEPDWDKFETHRRYIDIQYLAKGEEVIYMGNPDHMPVTVPFRLEKDIAFYHGSGEAHFMPEGSFLIIWPHEAHLPGCISGNGAMPIRKIIVKVAMDALKMAPSA